MPADDDHQAGAPLGSEQAANALSEVARLAHLADCAVAAHLPKPMTVAQYSVLKLLHDAPGPQTITRLARTLNVSQPTMFSTVNRLLKRDLVSMATLAHDRRAKQVELTAAGRAMKTQCDRHACPVLGTVAAQLPAHYWHSLQTLTADIADQFVAVLDKDGQEPAQEASGR